MSNEENDELTDLRDRIEALEAGYMALQSRLAALETGDRSGGRTAFHMADEEPTV